MRRLAAGAAALVALTAVLYAPALRGGFVWDDDFYVTENPTLRTVAGLHAIWTDPGATPQYYPLTHTSFWIEYRLWGLQPAGYHAVNVLLHALAAVLLWRLLRDLDVPYAWLAAAVFAAHPVQVESVAWITERKNVLSGALYLASGWCWIRYLRLGSAQERVGLPIQAVAGAMLFAGALLSKTVTASLPVSLALVAFWKRRRLRPGELALLGGMLVAGALMGSLTSWLERNQIGAQGGVWDLAWWERAGIAGRAWWFYLGKLAWPSGLSFVYPRWDPAVWTPGVTLALAAVLTVLAALALGRRVGRGPAVALLHYTVAIAPALGFFNVYPMRYSFVADHFQYLASVGPIVLVTASLAAGCRRVSGSPWTRRVSACIALAVLSAVCWNRAAAFRGPEELWIDTLSKNPSAWLAHNNLGARRALEGRSAEAEEHFRRVLALKPDHAGARANLGRLALGRGDTAEALRWLEEAVRLAPDDAASRISLGDAHLASGDREAARRTWADALRIDPSSPPAHQRLGRLLLAEGDSVEAVGHLRAAARAAPSDPAVRLDLGTALARAGNVREAIPEFEAAVRLVPDDLDALLGLGAALGAVGRLEEAEERFRRALRLDPASEPARRGLDRIRAIRSGPVDPTDQGDSGSTRKN